jgi:hypothetical protein
VRAARSAGPARARDSVVACAGPPSCSGHIAADASVCVSPGVMCSRCRLRVLRRDAGLP